MPTSSSRPNSRRADFVSLVLASAWSRTTLASKLTSSLRLADVAYFDRTFGVEVHPLLRRDSPPPPHISLAGWRRRRGRLVLGRNPTKSSSTLGPIYSGAVYPLDVFRPLNGIDAWALRTARRNSLKIRRCGRR